MRFFLFQQRLAIRKTIGGCVLGILAYSVVTEANAAAPGVYAYTWPNSTVFYSLKNADQPTASLFREATAILAEKTNVRFIERTTEPLYLDVTSHDGAVCGESAGVGRLNAPQQLSLGKQCLNRRVAIHEIIHALGFGHEHQRPDRDQYISIDKSLRDQAAYSIDHTLVAEGAYDVHSIMHYDDPRIVRLDGGIHLSGETLSQGDRIMINKYYKKPVLSEKDKVDDPVILNKTRVELGPGELKEVTLLGTSLAQILRYHLVSHSKAQGGLSRSMPSGLSLRDFRYLNGYKIQLAADKSFQKTYTLKITVRHRSGTKQVLSLLVVPKKGVR